MMWRLATCLIVLAAFSEAYGQEHSPARPSVPTQPRPSAARTPDPEGWVNFDSAEGHFSVLIPEIPQDKTETTDSAHGPYTTHLFITHDGNNLVYLIGWVDYDPSFNFNRQAELEANRDNFVKGITATLINSQSLTLMGFSAIEFKAEKDDRIFWSRVYMVGRRPYQIVVGYPKGENIPSDATKFLNSFKVRLP
jgi:hypothetical protein